MDSVYTMYRWIFHDKPSIWGTLIDGKPHVCIILHHHIEKKHLYPIMDDNIYTSYSCHTPIAILFFTAPKKIDKICQCFALGRLGGIGRARGPAGESW